MANRHLPTPRGPNPTLQHKFGTQGPLDQHGNRLAGEWDGDHSISSPRNITPSFPANPTKEDLLRMSPADRSQYEAQKITGDPSGKVPMGTPVIPKYNTTQMAADIVKQGGAGVGNAPWPTNSRSMVPSESGAPVPPGTPEDGPQRSKIAGFDSRPAVVPWTGPSLEKKLPPGDAEVRPVTPWGGGSLTSPTGTRADDSASLARDMKTYAKRPIPEPTPKADNEPGAGNNAPFRGSTSQEIADFKAGLDPEKAAADRAAIAAGAGTGKTIATQYGTASSTNGSASPAPDTKWQDSLVAKYPQLGVAGSDENKAFVAAHKAAGSPTGDAAMKIADSLYPHTSEPLEPSPIKPTGPSLTAGSAGAATGGAGSVAPVSSVAAPTPSAPVAAPDSATATRSGIRQIPQGPVTPPPTDATPGDPGVGRLVGQGLNSALNFAGRQITHSMGYPDAPSNGLTIKTPNAPGPVQGPNLSGEAGAPNWKQAIRNTAGAQSDSATPWPSPNSSSIAGGGDSQASPWDKLKRTPLVGESDESDPLNKLNKSYGVGNGSDAPGQSMQSPKNVAQEY